MTFFRIHDQFGFVGRNDDGPESLPDPGGGATFIAPIDTNFSQLVDVNFRLRILMTMGASGSFTRAVQMRRNLNGGGYVVVSAASSVVQTSPTTFYANRSDATEGIIGPLRNGYETWADDTNNHRVDDLIQTGNANYNFGNSYMSAEFCMKIIGVDVENGDTIQFRLQRSDGVNLSNYFITPMITVIKPHIGVFVKQARIFIPGATKSIISQLIRRRSIFVPGATQGKTFTPGVKQAKVFQPKIVATAKPLGGATQATIYTPGPTQAKVFKLIRHQVTFVPGATQGKTFRPGIKQSKVFIPGASKGKTI